MKKKIKKDCKIGNIFLLMEGFRSNFKIKRVWGGIFFVFFFFV